MPRTHAVHGAEAVLARNVPQLREWRRRRRREGEREREREDQAGGREGGAVARARNAAGSATWHALPATNLQGHADAINVELPEMEVDADRRLMRLGKAASGCEDAAEAGAAVAAAADATTITGTVMCRKNIWPRIPADLFVIVRLMMDVLPVAGSPTTMTWEEGEKYVRRGEWQFPPGRKRYAHCGTRWRTGLAARVVRTLRTISEEKGERRRMRGWPSAGGRRCKARCPGQRHQDRQRHKDKHA